jgi:hypothetical protein
MMYRISVPGFFFGLLLSAGIAAQEAITYQGQIQDGNEPYTGAVDLEFRLYDAVDGGNQVGFGVEKDDVQVVDGLFQVELQFGTNAFDGGERFIEVEVDGVALEPRQRVSAAPVALHALNVDEAATVWAQSGSTAYYTDGNVGIGTDSPATRLQVLGRFVSGQGTNVASGVDSATVGGGGNEATALFSFVGGGSDNEASGSRSFIGGGSVNEATGDRAFVAGGAGNLAAGTNSFVGGRRASALHSASFVWSDSSLGAFESKADDQFLVRARGGVGFNTDDPQTDFHVMGDVAVGNMATDVRMGVGTDNPWSTLHVVAPEDETPLRVMVENNDQESTAIRAYSHGGVAIGNSWPDNHVTERGLRVYGRGSFGSTVLVGQLSSQEDNDLCIRTSGILSDCSSSERYKEDITELESALAMVREMRPVRYNWTESGNADIGMIAEDMKEIAPEIVHYTDDGEVSGFQYSRLGAILAGAIQELEIQAAGELAELREENAQLRSEVAKLSDQAERNRHLEERLARLESVLLDDARLAEGESGSGR